MFEVAPDLLALLVLAAFAAGFVDSIAGGGGLIALPALLLAGAPPLTALATNKVQGIFGAGTAAITYARAGLVSPRAAGGPFVISVLAAAIGTLFAALLPVDLIRAALPVILIAIALFFALKPGLTDQDGRARMGTVAFGATLIPAVAFYDGLIGPGAGAFFMLGFVLLAGFGVLRATAHTKWVNFGSNLGSLAAFSLIATPWWAVGIAMGLAQVAGARLGARLAVRVGARIIKPLLVITATALALRLLTQG
jgi:uncharacterized membrane protein YfcA